MAYIGKTPITGNFVKLDAISVVNGQAGYTMNNGGSAFTDYENANQFLVSLNGILQAPTTSFTVSGSTLTFASNLATGDVIDFVIVLGNTLDIGTPSDATVTQAKTNFTTTSSSAGLQIKGDGTTDGTLQLNCSQNSHGIKLKSPPHSAGASYTLTFPNNDGNANQVLTTNGSGVLSFADAGGTHALVASSTITSNTSIVTLSGMDSTYNTYMVELENIVATSDNVQMGLRFTQGGSIIETNYQWFVARSGIAEGIINVHQHGDTSNIVFAHGVAGNNDPSVNGRIFIYNAPNTSMHTSIVATISLQHRDNHDHQLHHSHGEIQNNTASTAVSFRFSGGNIGSGVLKLYGVT